MAAGVPGTFRGVAPMFFSTRKRYFALAAPLLLFSIACTSEDGTTPTTAEPADTPTLVAPTAAPTSDPSPPSARPTATPASGSSNQPGPTPTPTPTVTAPVAAATPTPTPTATPMFQEQQLQELIVLQENLHARATAIALTPTATPPVETGNRIGDMAPDFTLTETSTGQPVQLAQLTEQGRPVVVYFFTTW